MRLDPNPNGTMGSWNNGGLVLGRSRTRWTNIETTLGELILFTEISSIPEHKLVESCHYFCVTLLGSPVASVPNVSE